MTNLPFSPEAEKSVVGAMLAKPKIIGEMVGTGIQVEHFHVPFLRHAFDIVVDAYFSDEPIDPLTIAHRGGSSLGSDPEKAAEQLRAIAGHTAPHEAIAHASIVKRDFDRRALIELAQRVMAQVQAEENAPEGIASVAAESAMKIATSRIHTNQIMSYGDLGRRFVARQQALMDAQRAGDDIGVKFDMHFLDDRMHGLKPGDLWILAGEAGVGKSAIAWAAAKAFAKKQLAKPDRRIGTFVASLEMGEEPSSDRLAAAAGHVHGSKIREGTTTDDELARIIKNWGAEKNAPLYFNFTSMIRGNQLRALIVEAIRRYNVGFVIIDHMRYWNADERYDNMADEDEAKARFLKESIAKELNVAVLVLAHTTKAIENSDDRRPRLSHLRGGGMVAAHADFVSFAYAPYHHATEDDKADGVVSDTDGEMLWEKARHGAKGPSKYYFDASIMHIRDAI